MFNKEQLNKAVLLQEKSYQLFKWLKNAIENKLISVSKSHDYLSETAAAKQWIEEHFQNIPNNARPNEEDIDAFSNVFSSYLTTSFDIDKNPGKVLYSPNAHCFCPMCSWLINTSHLKTKKLTSKDKKRAEKLKRIYIEELSMAINTQVTPKRIDEIINNNTVREELALVTYAAQLLLRMKGHKEGPALLALWRVFAWTDQGSPKNKFKLKTEDILNAENIIVQLVQT